MTFEAWLKLQIKRDDAVGDIARDFIDAKRIDMKTGDCDKFQKCDRDYLFKWGACSDAKSALASAKKEYEKYLKTAGE